MHLIFGSGKFVSLLPHPEQFWCPSSLQLNQYYRLFSWDRAVKVWTYPPTLAQKCQSFDVLFVCFGTKFIEGRQKKRQEISRSERNLDYILNHIVSSTPSASFTSKSTYSLPIFFLTYMYHQCWTSRLYSLSGLSRECIK